MKLLIEKKDLHKAVARTFGILASDKNTTKPLNLKTGPSRLHLMATDLTLAIYPHAPAEIIEEGQVGIPSRVFVEVCKELPDGLILLSVENSQLIISDEKKRFKLSIPILEG